ncbi:MAG: hypothetical protein NZ480_03745, partial [Bdellovibrionaceae bacterium]|nr:hypothetical protein [Pseudobdellovibrionaceae bacterium]
MSVISLAEFDLDPSLQKNLKKVLPPPLLFSESEKQIAGLIYQGHDVIVFSESLFELDHHYCWIALIEKTIRSHQNLGGGFTSWGHLS